MKSFNTIHPLTVLNRKFLVADLEIVREKGFEYFEKSEEWPVNENDFLEFSDFVRNSYNRIVCNINDPVVSDIALVESVFINKIINISHYNYVDRYCDVNNIDLIPGNESSSYLDPKWDVTGDYYSKLASSYNRLTEFLRNKFKNIVFNKHLSIDKIFYGIFTDSEVAGIGSNDRIKQEYVINNNLFCDNKGGSKFINDALLLYLKNTDNSSANNFSELVSKGVIEPFMREIRNSGLIFVKDVDYDAIERVWLQRFLDAYKIYKGLFLIDMPKTLLVTEVGKPHSKIITLVFQRRGCKVLNFHHGNDSVLVNQHWTYQLLFSHCDNYVVDTEVMRKRFEELSVDNKNIRKKATKFISINSNYYSKLRKYTHHTNSGKIMLMGYPMNLSRYPDGAYLFFHYKITLEHMLAGMITSSNYYLSYKTHPDRLKEIGSIMLDVSDHIIEQPFEDVWREAGVLVFTYVNTTTFCYALNLPIPIVLIDTPGTPWYKNMMKTIEKRVSILTVRVVDKKFIIDKYELLSAIDESYNKVSQGAAIEVTG